MKSSCHFRLSHAFALWLILIQPATLFAADGYEGYKAYHTGDYVVRDKPTTDVRTGKIIERPNWEKKSLSCYAYKGVPEIRNTPRTSREFYDSFYWGPGDKLNLYSIGMDPATLQPEGLDLNIFPSYPISDLLVLKPVLSYAADSVWERRGDLVYGAPKSWQNHYGELVRMIADTSDNDKPVEPIIPGGNSLRYNTPVEIQTYFINAEGQQISFYPDPDAFSGSDPDQPLEGSDEKPTIDTWYGEQGNYRLKHIKSPDPHFNLDSGSGLTYRFDSYKAENGKARPSQDREYLSVHYRVTKITDPYGHYIAISYDDSLHKGMRVASATAFSVAGTLLHTIDYRYDNLGRLKEIEVPAFDGTRNTYLLYYPDQDQAAASHVPAGVRLADSGAVRFKNGAMVEVTQGTNSAGQSHQSNEVAFEYFTKADGSLPSVYLPDDLSSSSQGAFVYANSAELGFYMRMPLRFPRLSEDQTAPQHSLVADSHHLTVLPVSSTNPSEWASFKFGLDGQISSQQKPLIHSEHGQLRSHSQDVLRQGMHFNSATPDVMLISRTEGTTPLVSSANGSYKLRVYPVIKKGDLIIESTGVVHEVTSDQATSTINPEKISLDGSISDATNLRHVRRDNRDRVAMIVFPQTSEGMQRKMVIAYEDQSINHEAIRSVAIYDDSLPLQNGKAIALQETNYEYEMVRVIPGAEDSHGEYVPRKARPCQIVSNRVYGNGLVQDCANMLTIGLSKARLQEMDLLRRKTVRFADYDTSGELEFDALVTEYGGAWKFVLAADTMDESFGGSPEGHPSHKKPSPGDIGLSCDTGDCYMIYWGLRAKPFDFTWTIHPDGSADINDLTAKGLDLDPMLAHANRGSRVFKVYKFGNNFRTKFEAAYGQLRDFHGRPASTYQPPYQSQQSIMAMRTNPYPVSGDHVPPSLQDIFALNGVTCYAAEVTGFEPVAPYKYNLSTGPSNPQDFFHDEMVGALNGFVATSATVNCDNHYLRTSAIELIHDEAAGNAATHLGLAEDLLSGQLASKVAYWTLSSNDPVCADSSSATYDRNYVEISTNSLSCVLPQVESLPIIWTGYDIAWELGGRTGHDNHRLNYQHRQKLHRLNPAHKTVLKNYQGLSWDSVNQCLDFNDTDVVSVERYSSSRNLGSANVTAYTAPALNPDGSMPATATVNLDSTPSGLMPGDVLYGNYRYYTIESVNGNNVTVSPAPHYLETRSYEVIQDSDPNQPESYTTINSVKFYRYYNPDWQGGVTNDYQGHDAFGNNSFSELYAGNSGIQWNNGFVPDFSNAEPTQRSLNDSTLVANSDTSNWRFFGRTTYQFDAHKDPFSDDGAIPAGDISDGFVSKTEFHSDWGWLPSKMTQYYRPQTYSATGSVVTDPEDRHTENSYHDSNDIARGKLATETITRTLNFSTEFEKRWIEYDSNGYLAVETKVNAKDGDPAEDFASYGLRNVFVNDANTGLQKVSVTGAVALDSQLQVVGFSASQLTFSRFDELGRALLSYTNHAGNTTFNMNTAGSQKIGSFQKTALFGPVVRTQHVSPLETKTLLYNDLTLTGGIYDVDDTDLMESQWVYTDGLGRETFTVKKLEPGGDYYGSGTAYDTLGRESVVYASQSFDRVDDGTFEKPVTELFKTGGFTEHIYNSLGQHVGEIQKVATPIAGTNDERTQLEILGSRWIAEWQDPAGDWWRFNYHQDRDENQARRLVVKALLLDDQQRIVEVIDYALPPSLSQDMHSLERAEAELANFRTSLNPSRDGAIAYASYEYLRDGNVYRLSSGLDPLAMQTREFRFDRMGRLRFEMHPEMSNTSELSTIHYSDFTLQGHAKKILARQDLNGTTPGDRREDRTYNRYGNLLQIDYYVADGNTSFALAASDQFTYTDYINTSDKPFVGLKKVVMSSEGSDAVGYRYHYHDKIGLVTRRDMLHSFSDFDGFGMAMPTLNEGHANWDQALSLNYTYDVDQSNTANLNRVVEMRYPTSPSTTPGNAPILDFSYDGTYGSMLSDATDKSLGSGLPVLSDIRYGIEKQLLGYTLLGDQDHIVEHSYDAFNRLSHQAFQAGNSRMHQQYIFDSSGRIIKIQDISSGVATNDSQFAYDGLDQLIEAAVPGVDGRRDLTYSYDEFGNMLTMTQSHQGESELNLSFQYSRNQRTGSAYNAFGELTMNERGHEFTYNARGRMSSALIPDPNGNYSDTYAYDVFGMRVLKVDGDTGQKTLYFYDDKNMVLSEYRFAPAVVDTNGTITKPSELRWNKSQIYIDGQTGLTYSFETRDWSSDQSLHNRMASAGLELEPAKPAPPALKVPALGLEPVLEWGKVNDFENFALEIGAENSDGMIETVRKIGPIKRHHYRPSGLTENAWYYARVAVDGSYFSPWRKFFVPFDAMLSRYDFNGELIDETGLSTATLMAGAGFAPGLDGDAIAGANGLAIVEQGYFLDWPYGKNRRTYLAWFRPDDTDGTDSRTIFDIGPPIINHAEAGYHRVELQQVGGQLRLHLGKDFYVLQNERPDFLLIAEDWNHVSVTWNGSAWAIYLNGKRVGYQLVNDTNTKGIRHGVLGSKNPYTTSDGQLQPIQGLLDRFEVHSRDLSWTELQNRYKYEFQ